MINEIIWLEDSAEENTLTLEKTLLKNIKPKYEPKILAKSRLPIVSPR